MDSRKIVFRETRTVAFGVGVCVGAMIAIFSLAGYYSTGVLLGGLFGGVLTVLNFFFMAITASLAADKAQAGDVAGGKKQISASRTLRLVILAVTLFALGKSGLCQPLALVLPLVFTQPVLTVAEFFRKKGA